MRVCPHTDSQDRTCHCQSLIAVGFCCLSWEAQVTGPVTTAALVWETEGLTLGKRSGAHGFGICPRWPAENLEDVPPLCEIQPLWI